MMEEPKVANPHLDLQTTILIAEDDDGHATLIIKYLKSAGLSNLILRFKDGKELLEYLKPDECKEMVLTEKAFLLFLDIKMPRVDGIEVLKILKTDPMLRKIPVIMLTTTDDPKEIDQCYSIGCNSYVVKPVEFKKFSDTLKKLGQFISIVNVPKVATGSNTAV